MQGRDLNSIADWTDGHQSNVYLQQCSIFSRLVKNTRQFIVLLRSYQSDRVHGSGRSSHQHFGSDPSPSRIAPFSADISISTYLPCLAFMPSVWRYRALALSRRFSTGRISMARSYKVRKRTAHELADSPGRGGQSQHSPIQCGDDRARATHREADERGFNP